MEKEEIIEGNVKATLKDIGREFISPSREEGTSTEEVIKELLASREAPPEVTKELAKILEKVEKDIMKPTTGGKTQGKIEKEKFQADMKEKEQEGKVLGVKAGETVSKEGEMTREGR